MLDILLNSARGRDLGFDDSLLVFPPPIGPAMAVVGLPGRHVVASSAPEAWVRGHLPLDDLMAPLSPRFITQLAAKLGRYDDGVDVLLAASGLDQDVELFEVDPTDHPRVARDRDHRDEVRAFTEPSQAATLILGRGLVGRWEVAVEVSPEARNRGLATRMLYQARCLVDAADVLFAQVAAANAASMRALLNAGFAPIGAEVLFFEGARATM